jgi:membrane protein implicated in regulation of membrane protease activity
VAEPPPRTSSDPDPFLSLALWFGAFAGVVALGILLLAVSAPTGVKFVAAVVVVLLTVLCAAALRLLERPPPKG